MTTSEISLAYNRRSEKPTEKHKRKVEKTYWRVLLQEVFFLVLQSLPDIFISLVSLLQVGLIFPVCEYILWSFSFKRMPVGISFGLSASSSLLDTLVEELPNSHSEGVQSVFPRILPSHNRFDPVFCGEVTRRLGETRKNSEYCQQKWNYYDY